MPVLAFSRTPTPAPSLTNEDLYAQREGFLASAVDNNFKAYELGQAQYGVGKIDLLSLLQMQPR
ncbi:MAG: hypothetical protein WBO54_17965 [Thermoanaerobaculia bacterium]